MLTVLSLLSTSLREASGERRPLRLQLPSNRLLCGMLRRRQDLHVERMFAIVLAEGVIDRDE
jgi:hypothetical protein